MNPLRVQFQSRNFHNVLHWQPGRAPSNHSRIYFVQYKKYGQKEWKNKAECWETQELFCDLTDETSDLRELYYGRVRMASAGNYSGWSMTRRFTPWWATNIDPPVINVTQHNGSVLVVLHAPDFPYRHQKGTNVTVENYYDLVYRVFLINNSLEKEQNIYEGAGRVVEIGALMPHSGYCIVAEIYQPMLGRSSQRSEEICVKIP
ncbi:interleukin-22 receptor subunit alpha-2 isoform X2 [Perognathus longimembris pacificus]|nr:interleukin-22 receptor subunit alpha-2 isoform X2 [Perognathus longimembris pacificus]